MSPSDRRPPVGLAAEWIVRLAGLWLFLGAAAKLYMGTPKDLPPSVIDIARSLSMTLDLTFRVVIGIELGLVALAWLRPKLAWLPMVAVLAFFDWVLTTQLTAGAESCGCFGSTITVPPTVMLVIDSVLLLAILLSKPWSIERDGAPFWIVALAALAGFVAPWVFIPKAGVSAPVATGTGDAPTSGAPPTTGRYVEPQPATWVGQMIWDVEDLAKLVDAAILPSDGKVVLWRQGCSHCAEHLRTLFEEDDGTLPIVLLQIQDDPADSRAVDVMPEGAHVTRAEFPKDLQFVLETPWELVVEGGIVTQAIGPDELEPPDAEQGD